MYTKENINELIDVIAEFVEVCSYIRDAGNDDDPTLVEAIAAGHEVMKKYKVV